MLRNTGLGHGGPTSSGFWGFFCVLILLGLPHTCLKTTQAGAKRPPPASVPRNPRHRLHYLPQPHPMVEHVNWNPSLGQGCPAECNRRGRCVQGRCECVVAWSGDDCSLPVNLPCKQRSVNFTGWALNVRAAEHDLSLYGSGGTGELNPILGTEPDKLGAFTRILKDHLLVPPFDPLMRMLGKSCALVGSSDILLKCDVGAQINAHDVIIRLNDAPTQGFERHVGNRTTLRFQGTMRALFREGDELTINLSHAYMYNGGGHNLIAYSEIAGSHGYYNLHRGYSNLEMSFGWKAIHAAMHLCGSLTLFGFSAEANPRHLPKNGFSHYYAKWYDSKPFSLYALTKVGIAGKGVHDTLPRACTRLLKPGMTRPRMCATANRDYWPTESRPSVSAQWWGTSKRARLTIFLNDARNIERFRHDMPQAHVGRMEEFSVQGTLGKYGLQLNCTLPWTNHCIEEEAACTSQLPSMVPRVKLVCCGVGTGNGL